MVQLSWAKERRKSKLINCLNEFEDFLKREKAKENLNAKCWLKRYLAKRYLAKDSKRGPTKEDIIYLEKLLNEYKKKGDLNNE